MKHSSKPVIPEGHWLLRGGIALCLFAALRESSVLASAVVQDLAATPSTPDPWMGTSESVAAVCAVATFGVTGAFRRRRTLVALKEHLAKSRRAPPPSAGEAAARKFVDSRPLTYDREDYHLGSWVEWTIDEDVVGSPALLATTLARALSKCKIPIAVLRIREWRRQNPSEFRLVFYSQTGRGPERYAGVLVRFRAQLGAVGIAAIETSVKPNSSVKWLDSDRELSRYLFAQVSAALSF